MWVFVVLGCCFACILLLYLSSRRKGFSVKGKHVVITGGSSGIGRCLAAGAIKRGAAVVTLVARNKVRLQAAKEELEKLISGGSEQRVCVIAADVAVLTQVREGLSRGVKEAGHEVDVLVNCAGITHTATMLETPDERYQELMNVNVLGSVYATKAVLPSMVKRKTGAIIFISSQAGQLGLYGYTAYSATKYSLRGLAETLQMETRPHNIQVNISFPPDTDTPQLQAEMAVRDDIQTELAAFGNVFQPQVIAEEVWSGVERNKFQITHGFDGFMLGTATSGISPAHKIWTALVQMMLMGLFRGVALIYLMMFNRVVTKGLAKINKQK